MKSKLKQNIGFRKKGNTVGSQKILTLRQKAILIGTLLGDGTLELNGQNVRLRIDHSMKQKDYVEWKHKEFFNLAPSGVRDFAQKINCRTGKIYRHSKFDTFSNIFLNEFYRMFYIGRRKRVPNNIVKILKKPLSLAVWFMDDGYKRNDCNALRISTDSFSIKEQELLLQCLKQNFKINAKIHKKGKNWNIYIPSSEAKEFCDIIKPYIIPSMEYKIF